MFLEWEACTMPLS